MLIKIIKPFVLLLTLGFALLLFSYGWHYITAVEEVNHLAWILSIYLAFWILLLGICYKFNQIGDRLKKKKMEAKEVEVIKTIADNELETPHLNDLSLSERKNSSYPSYIE